MKVECEKCHTEYDLEASLIKKKGSKFRCAKCEHIFKVYPPVIVDEGDSVGKKISASVSGPDTNTNKTLSGLPPIFKIVGENNCPLYDLDDEFRLSGSSFFPPRHKAPCLILVKDVMKILKHGGYEKFRAKSGSEPVFHCSGCTGLIRFAYKKEDKKNASPSKRPEDYIGVVARSLSKFSIFQSLDESIVKEFTSHLKFEEFAVGDTIIRKGDPGRNLYIIVSGKVEVVGDDDMSLAFMGKGEVFGEMSLLSGNPVGATIKVMKPATVLYIVAKDFKKVLNKSPSLQMYFTRLLAGRMAEINMARSEEFASGMAGKLSEMPPSELFQTFNMNQKTGVLTLKLPDTTAYLSFREGGLVSVKYDGKEGEEAFFELLKLKRGRFKFIPGLSAEEMEASEVGDFMHLLMEGLRRIDEDDRRFIRTVIPALTD
ncbi:DUF4388 domain-containing protein [Desulfonema magnum]|uniref:Cyclic nucleotide-binding domain-containing protein, DUF4388 n=1 Tax=Desulfonema magnum TaxID=45655 RepID=A0A975BKR7_9BACT|nr:DUF4388 domain-containing protein [Desulfonema magnum]QTA87367.1 Cyclic nucleotide-binding domain-containing protein, DUF4388 [Desulfonema magnum]